jgi:hypothetical protein
MRAPSSIVNEMSLNSGVAPNCFVIDCAFRMGGISSRVNSAASLEAIGPEL